MAIDLLSSLGGPAADLLVNNNFDVGVLRPWKGRDGRSYITKMVDGKPKILTTNTPATLTRDAWIAFDTAIQRAVMPTLRVYRDIRAAGLTYNLPNGMAHTVLQYQTMGDITPATVSMDPIRRGEADKPTTDVANMPLPIIHKDFDFSARELLVSRNGQMPLDTTTAELAATKVAEEVEKMALGTAGTFTYAGGTLYGLTNFPQRATKFDMPVPDGTNGGTVVTALLALRQLLIANKHTGPFRLYVNSQWPVVLDNDFSTSKGDQTLRQRILSIADIQDIQVSEFLGATRWECVLVEMKSSSVRAVIGMEVQTVQWESLGGLMKHFKVMCMLLTQVRADSDGNSGVAHGKTAA